MRIAAATIALLGLFAPRFAEATETVTYTYDARGRLVTVLHSGSINNGVNATYTHDNSDNRLNVTVTGASN